jgi:hypothetical protein
MSKPELVIIKIQIMKLLPSIASHDVDGRVRLEIKKLD